MKFHHFTRFPSLPARASRFMNLYFVSSKWILFQDRYTHSFLFFMYTCCTKIWHMWWGGGWILLECLLNAYNVHVYIHAHKTPKRTRVGTFSFLRFVIFVCHVLHTRHHKRAVDVLTCLVCVCHRADAPPHQVNYFSNRIHVCVCFFVLKCESIYPKDSCERMYICI